MIIFNDKEVDVFCWDCTQMGGVANGVKALVNGEIINIAWKNSITGEVLAIQWDYTGKFSKGAGDCEQAEGLK